HYHPALAALGPVRRALGVRTVFNLLGPLANPAAPPFAVIGAASPGAALILAETLAGLPIERAYVVHGAPGWDEPTPVGPFLMFEVTPGAVRRGARDPFDSGLPRCRPEELLGGDAATNARRLEAVFSGERGAHRDALLLGAGLGLAVSGRAPTLAAGIEAATAAPRPGFSRRSGPSASRRSPRRARRRRSRRARRARRRRDERRRFPPDHGGLERDPGRRGACAGERGGAPGARARGAAGAGALVRSFRLRSDRRVQAPRPLARSAERRRRPGSAGRP